MHIALDESSIHTGHGARGTGVYVKELVRALKKYEKEHTYTLFTRTKKIPKKCDIVHIPYFDPFFLTLPAFFRKPFVVTIHDLIPIRFSGRFRRGLRGEIKWQIQRRRAGKASRIISDSYASKADIARYLPFPSEKIDIIPLAPRDAFFPETGRRRLENALDSYGVKPPYIIYIGDINWNKNIPGLLRGFAQAVKTIPNLTLLLVGKAFLDTTTEEARSIGALCSDLSLIPRIRMTGYVNDSDLRLLLCAASSCVQVSFAEGFGLPVLEAMACGCPVVTSRSMGIAEIAGPSVTVDPENPEDIGNGIVQSIRKPKPRDEYVSFAKQFTWRTVAKKTVQVYKTIYEEEKT